MENYSKLNFINGSPPAISAASLNHMEDGIYNASEAVTAVEDDVSNIQNQINDYPQVKQQINTVSNSIGQLQSQMQEVETTINEKANTTALALKVDKTNIISEFDKLLTDTEKIPTAVGMMNFLSDYYYDINDTYSIDEIDEKLLTKAMIKATSNILVLPDFTETKNGITVKCNNNHFVLSGTANASATITIPINMNLNGQYVLSCQNALTNAHGTASIYTNSNKINDNPVNIEGGAVSFEANCTATSLRVWFPANTVFDGQAFDIQLESGMESTEFNAPLSVIANSLGNKTVSIHNLTDDLREKIINASGNYVLTSADKQEIANLVNADTDTTPGYVRTAAGNIAEKMIGITGEFIGSSQPAYTNQLFTSTESDGTTIYNNGTGYKTGYRLNSSNDESAQTGFCVTGYIPCAPGDIVRLKNISFNANGASIGSVKIVAYKSDKTVLSSCAVGNMTAVSGVFDDTGNLTQFTTVANCHYFRLSCYDINANSIITLNEEITTTEATGHDCVPFNFAFLSDIHYSANYKNGIKHTEQALNVISERAHIDLVAFGGDYIPNWTRMTKTNAVAAITETKINYSDIKTPCLWLKGNHDNNGYTGERLSKAEIYNRIMCKNRDVHGFIENPNDPYGGYGYVDFDNSKIRVIVVNTSDNDNMSAKSNESGAIAPVINAHNVSAVQIQWLADHALDFSDKTSANEWGIIVISHVPIFAASSVGYWTSYTDGDNKSWTLNRQNVADLIKAYIDKTSFTATLNGETAAKDFSSLTETAEVICFVNGHGHSERVGTYNGFKFIWCPATAAVASKSDDGNTYTKTADTVNDTAFTMFTVDRANHKIHAWNYGAGYDREIGY